MTCEEITQPGKVWTIFTKDKKKSEFTLLEQSEANHAGKIKLVRFCFIWSVIEFI